MMRQILILWLILIILTFLITVRHLTLMLYGVMIRKHLMETQQQELQRLLLLVQKQQTI